MVAAADGVGDFVAGFVDVAGEAVGPVATRASVARGQAGVALKGVGVVHGGHSLAGSVKRFLSSGAAFFRILPTMDLLRPISWAISR